MPTAWCLQLGCVAVVLVSHYRDRLTSDVLTRIADHKIKTIEMP